MRSPSASIFSFHVSYASAGKSVGASAMASSTTGTSMSSICAPAKRRRSTAPSNASRGSSSIPSNAAVRSTASLTPESDGSPRSAGPIPSRAASSSAASSTDLQSGPTVSNRGQRGTTPSSERRPHAVFRPTRSFQADGMRTEPPVSEPIPAAASPNATEAAAPEDEPPETASGSFTQGGDSVTGFSPSPENASSV